MTEDWLDKERSTGQDEESEAHGLEEPEEDFGKQFLVRQFRKMSFRQQVAELALQKYSPNVIALRLNATLGQVQEALREALQEVRHQLFDNMEDVVLREAASLDRDEASLREVLEPLMAAAKISPVQRKKAGKELPGLLNSLLALQKRRSELLGLDRPQKFQLAIGDVANLTQKMADIICENLPDDRSRTKVMDAILRVINQQESKFAAAQNQLKGLPLDLTK